MFQDVAYFTIQGSRSNFFASSTGYNQVQRTTGEGSITTTTPTTYTNVSAASRPGVNTEVTMVGAWDGQRSGFVVNNCVDTYYYEANGDLYFLCQVRASYVPQLGSAGAPIVSPNGNTFYGLHSIRYTNSTDGVFTPAVDMLAPPFCIRFIPPFGTCH